MRQERVRRQPRWFLWFVLALGALSAGSTPWMDQAFGERQEKPKKRQLSSYEWKKLMNQWARELSVKCDYCHSRVGEDEIDPKAKGTPKKAIALYCDQHFVQRLQLNKRAVSCQTCHQGKPTFLPRPAEEGRGGKDEGRGGKDEGRGGKE